jgi:lipopolysaccharide/colanic/teichoic acid biosynthesis glycosyltransferase/glycosyltransferase involved in cell wall biosynthesis
MNESPRRLLHVTTIPMSLVFLRGQVGFMQQRGIDVSVLSSPGPDLEEFARAYGVRSYAVDMRREITPLRDIASLWAMRRIVRSLRPHIVHAHTPKGGLLGMLAAALGGVPLRVYHMRGLPLATATGWRRRLLWLTEWIACRLAHHVLCVSHSLRQLAVDTHVCPADKIEVPLGGSGNGVDALERFNRTNLALDAREATRARFGIPADARVIGFVGRLVRDKGIVELADAWRSLREAFPNAHLILVGPLEPQDPIPATVRDALEHDERVHFAGMDWNTPPLYAAMDVVALPTYREGFPNVPLEAAAMELPVVATRIPGCVEAIADGETGALVPTRDASALARALATYLADPVLVNNHGAAGRERALRDFRQERIWAHIYDMYERPLPNAHDLARRRFPQLAKRAMDAVVAGIALVLLSPVLLITAIVVRISLGAPVLFQQVRPGRGGRPFTLYKFRTMRDAMDAAGRTLPDGERLTNVGRVLRNWSLDELPELWNVVKGDMSLVGPRPLLMEYLALYSTAQARRHDVRPGMTGWAQVHGRNAQSWDERLALDVWYVDNHSLALDLRILARTIAVVLARQGVTQPGHATMERFRGSPG